MTRRRITIALAVVAGLLGIVHLALATLIFGIWTTDVLWFVGMLRDNQGENSATI